MGGPCVVWDKNSKGDGKWPSTQISFFAVEKMNKNQIVILKYLTCCYIFNQVISVIVSVICDILIYFVHPGVRQ